MARRWRGLTATGATALIVFVACAVFAVVSWPPLRRLDTVAAASGHRLLVHATALRQVTLIVTDRGSPLAVDVVAVAVLLLTRRRRAAVAVAVARLGETGHGNSDQGSGGATAARSTTSFGLGERHELPVRSRRGSAAVYGAIVMIPAASFPKPGRVTLQAATAAFVLVVGASRVLLGVHFPTDVVGGFALGVVWIAVAQAVLRWGGARDPDAR